LGKTLIAGLWKRRKREAHAAVARTFAGKLNELPPMGYDP